MGEADGSMDSFQALGLCEEAMHFDVEVSFPGSQPKIFDISTRDTVDKVKSIAFTHFCSSGKETHDDYLLGISEKERLEIEFVRFILAHSRIREDLESGELVKIGLYKKGVVADTTVKEKIDLHTDINFEARRSSVSISLSKLHVAPRRTSGPASPVFPTSPTTTSKSLFKRDKNDHPLAFSQPVKPAFLSSGDLKKEHKRHLSESGIPEEEGKEKEKEKEGKGKNTPTTPVGRLAPSISSSALGKLVRTQSSRPSAGGEGEKAPLSPSLTPPQSPVDRTVHLLPSLPPGTLLPLLDPAAKGFMVEPGAPKTQIEARELIITDPLKSEPWYSTFFFGKEHSNYMGTDDTMGVFIVSVVQESPSSSPLLPSEENHVGLDVNGHEDKETMKIRAIVRTKKGDDKKTSKIKSTGLFKSKKISGKDIMQNLCPYLSSSKLNRIKDPDMVNALKTFEDRQLIRSYKFGVLYCKAGQTEEEQMFSNEAGSADFDEFLSAIGEKVTLQGWPHYRAGLDVKGGSTGTHSVYSKFKSYEVMYHVSTLLPYSEHNPQQLERKRHIGNDIVVIVFKEGDQPYDPNCIKSEFNHIFAVVTKLKKPNDPKTYYRLSIALKEGVPSFKPDLPSHALFEKGDLFREYLLCKLINGENTSYEAPSFKIKIQRTRLALLKDLESRFTS